MNKEEFYAQYGHRLVEVAEDDPEYGNHMLVHPEECWFANDYIHLGYEVASVYETNTGDVVELDNDISDHPYKIGYLVLKKD